MFRFRPSAVWLTATLVCAGTLAGLTALAFARDHADPLQNSEQPVPTPSGKLPNSTSSPGRALPDVLAPNSTSPTGDLPNVPAPNLANDAEELNAARPGETTSPSRRDGISELNEQLERTLNHYHRYLRRQSTADRSPWAMMHAAIAYGADTFIQRGPGGPQVSPIGWLLWNGPSAGQRILYLDGRGGFGVHRGPGVQGHEGQLLAVLAQSRIKPDYPIRIEGRQFTVSDLIEYEKRTCQPGTELTFKLIGLSWYLDTDATWTCQSGQSWSIERLIREELAQPVIRNAACGGTHRMMGFSYAVRMRERSGRPMTGEFRRAQRFVQEFHRYAFALQNPDGSFSTEWFQRRADSGDAERKLDTSGHVFEWLAFSLSEEELRDPRTVRAALLLCRLLMSAPDRDWSIGPLGHALHGLRVYHDRLIGPWERPPAE
jgi:hypothetical protein